MESEYPQNDHHKSKVVPQPLQLESRNISIVGLDVESDPADVHGDEKQDEQSTKTDGSYSIESERKIIPSANSKIVVLHTFMSFGTVAECAFDFVQGLVFLRGFDYETKVRGMILIGTWCGVGDEIIDLVLDTLGIFFANYSFPGKLLFLYCFILLIFVVFEQSLAIYAAVHGLKHIGWFMWVPVISAGIILALSMYFLVYLMQRIRKGDMEFKKGSQLPFSGAAQKVVSDIFVSKDQPNQDSDEPQFKSIDRKFSFSAKPEDFGTQFIQALTSNATFEAAVTDTKDGAELLKKVEAELTNQKWNEAKSPFKKYYLEQDALLNLEIKYKNDSNVLSGSPKVSATVTCQYHFAENDAAKRCLREKEAKSIF